MYTSRKFFILFFFLWTGALLLAAVVPSFKVSTTFYNIFTPIYVDVPAWIFDSLSNYQETLRTIDTSNYNPFQDFIWLVWWLAMVACALILPIIWWVVITFIFWLSIYATNQRIALAMLPCEGSPEASNWMHLINGRTSIQKTFDAEVQANSIASALKRHK